MSAFPRGRLRRWLPARRPDSHKGDFGHVLIVAGSRGMSGAAVLASQAALRAGAGLVTAAVPASQQAVVAVCVPEALTLGLPETPEGTLSANAPRRIFAFHRQRRYTVLGLGPGLSTHPETSRAVLAILRNLDLPVVLDADALNILSLQPFDLVCKRLSTRKAPAILTPHPGEMARLLRWTISRVQSNRPAAAKRLAQATGQVCLLKGHRTVVTDGRRAVFNPAGNSGLAKGGSGDVLTGVIAALWSQRMGRPGASGDRGFEAAALGAYLHGLAADIAVRINSKESLLASDVIDSLPAAFRTL